jgi:hypothetical protein
MQRLSCLAIPLVELKSNKETNLGIINPPTLRDS